MISKIGGVIPRATGLTLGGSAYGKPTVTRSSRSYAVITRKHDLVVSECSQDSVITGRCSCGGRSWPVLYVLSDVSAAAGATSVTLHHTTTRTPAAATRTCS